MRILDYVNLEIYNCQKWVFYYFVKRKSLFLGELVVKCDIRKKKLVYRKGGGERALLTNSNRICKVTNISILSNVMNKRQIQEDRAFPIIYILKQYVIFLKSDT